VTANPSDNGSRSSKGGNDDAGNVLFGWALDALIVFESNPCKPRVIGLAGVLLCGGGFQAALWFGL
jgi:hypothetical protein